MPLSVERRPDRTPSNLRARELLTEVGTALYGPQWLSPMAAALGIRFDTVRQWVNGKQERFDLSHPVWPKIAELVAERADACAAALAAIRKETTDV
jgi:hypothetical protein